MKSNKKKSFNAWKNLNQYLEKKCFGSCKDKEYNLSPGLIMSFLTMEDMNKPGIYSLMVRMCKYDKNLLNHMRRLNSLINAQYIIDSTKMRAGCAKRYIYKDI